MKALQPKYTREILRTSGSSTQVLDRLYSQLKRENPKLSLSLFCKATGLRSTGYASDVLSGKRFLSEKYLAGLAQAVKFDALETEYFSLLLRLDRSKNKLAAVLAPRLRVIRRALEVEREESLHNLETQVDFHLTLLSAFSLFGGHATADEIVSIFQQAYRFEARLALQNLAVKGYVVADSNGRFSPVQTRMVFGKSADGFSHLAFLKESIMKAGSVCESLYEKRDESIFASTIISVKKSFLQSQMQRLKAEMIRMQAELESEEPDALLRFNVQVYIDATCKK